MTECEKPEDPTFWEWCGIIALLLLSLLTFCFLVAGILLAVVGKVLASIICFLLFLIFGFLVILLGLWLADLLERLYNRHSKLLDRLKSLAKRVDKWLDSIIPKKEDNSE